MTSNTPSLSLSKSFLEGKGIMLRGLLLSDLSGGYPSWFNDPEVTRFNSHGRFPKTPQEMEDYYRSVTRSSDNLVLAIIEKSSGLHIGNISLQKIQWTDRSAEYAIVLGERSSWGKGYGKEASDLILAHGFLELNLHRIYCGTSANNEGMKKLAAHMGMKEEGRRRDAIFKHGKYQDILEYGLLREEYLKLKSS